MIQENQDINFTPRSQKLLQICKEIAKNLNYKEVKPEHLFAAFFELKKSRSIEVLAEAGLDLSNFKHHLYATVLVEQPEKENPDEFKISKKVKSIISEARELAENLGHSWVSAEHIFLSFFKDISYLPTEISMFLGVDLELVTGKILEYLCDKEEVNSSAETGVQDLLSVTSDIGSKCWKNLPLI